MVADHDEVKTNLQKPGLSSVNPISLQPTYFPKNSITLRYIFFIVAVPAIGVGQTVAGLCNGTLGNGPNDLDGPWGIYVSPSNGTLYVADCDGLKFEAFSPFSRTGSTIFSGGLSTPGYLR